MGLYYLPFWLEVWWKDYKIQALPRHVRLILYDVMFLLWDKDMHLPNNDAEICFYLRISETEWIDAKTILFKHEFLTTKQAGKLISCNRLQTEYDRVLEEGSTRTNKAKNAAKKRWAEHNKLK